MKQGDRTKYTHTNKNRKFDLKIEANKQFGKQEISIYLKIK